MSELIGTEEHCKEWEECTVVEVSSDVEQVQNLVHDSHKSDSHEINDGDLAISFYELHPNTINSFFGWLVLIDTKL